MRWLPVLNAGADCTAANHVGLTSLHWAAAGGHTPVIEALLAAPGGATDLGNGCVGTPLHLAAAQGKVEALRALLAAGARQVFAAVLMG